MADKVRNQLLELITDSHRQHVVSIPVTEIQAMRARPIYNLPYGYCSLIHNEDVDGEKRLIYAYYPRGKSQNKDESR